MENASKALIMAAGVLIGIMILSVAVFLFISFAETSSQIHKQIDANQINQFNTQFTSIATKDEITIHDIISVAYLAKDNNNYYSLTTPGTRNASEQSNYYITVSLKRH